jgi:threonine/homoserine/homoserine lactone efflux protein
MHLTETSPSKLSHAASFLSGLLLTLGDVKAILFYASLFPAFVDMDSLSAPDMAGIAAVTILAVGGVKIFYAFAARTISARFRDRNAQRLARKSAGCCMIGAGTYIIMKA